MGAGEMTPALPPGFVLDGGVPPVPPGFQLDTPQDQSFPQKLGRAVLDAGAGAVRGAGSIGATILAPIDVISDAIDGKGLTLESNRKRRADMTGALENLGADTNSLAFHAGKIGGEVAGTLGAGGAVANGLRAIPGVASAAPGVLTAIESAGFTAGQTAPGIAGTAANLGARAVGGAVTGGASAGLVNPEDAAAGVAIGAVTPAIVKAAGAFGSALRGTQTATPQAMDAARKGAQAGYVVPPEDIGGGVVTKALSGLSGKVKTAQVASQRNQDVTNTLAKQALGLPANATLDVAALQGIRDTAGQAYDAMRSLGTVKTSAAYDNALSAAESAFHGAAKSFPGLKRNDVSDLIAAMRQPSFDAGDAIDALKVLRGDTDKAFAAGDTELGRAYRKVTEALETELERYGASVGAPDLVKAFREARQTIAKTYTVQGALNAQTGDVAAGKLAARMAKGKPTTGELADIAEFAGAFPRATQTLKEAPKTLSPLDFLGAAVGAGSTGNVLGGLGLLARPAARSMLLSAPAQSVMLRQQSPAQTAIAQALRDRLGSASHRVAPLFVAD